MVHRSRSTPRPGSRPPPWYVLEVCSSPCRVRLSSVASCPVGKELKGANLDKGGTVKRNGMRTIAIVMPLVGSLGGSALSAQDKYTLKVPGGLAFAEFRGYEGWQLVSISQDGPAIAAILANSV